MKWRKKWNNKIRNSKFRLFRIMIANMFMKLDVVKIFDKTTFTCKDFCFDFFNANLFDFFIDLLLFLEHTCLFVSFSLLLINQINFVNSNLFLFLLLFEHASLFDLSFMFYVLQWFLHIFNKLLDNLRNVIAQSLLFWSRIILIDIHFLSLLNL